LSEAVEALSKWHLEGKLNYRVHVIDALKRTDRVEHALRRKQSRKADHQDLAEEAGRVSRANGLLRGSLFAGRRAEDHFQEQNMAAKFDGKVALVTGGNSGIGRAAAIAFAREGARVVIAARRIREGEETVQIIKDAGGHALFVQTDVSQGEAVETVLQRTLAAYGRLDYAFNNAGIAVLGPFLEVTEADFDRVIGINLKGVWFCMKAEMRQMLTQGGGAIVNMSSTYGLSSSSIGASAYTASKHGIIGLTKAAALEYAKAGIRVNAVVPGWIRTPMVEEALKNAPQLEARILDHQPVGRLGRPEEVAEAVVWLCSEAASLVSGHSMTIDGGLSSSVGT